MHTRSCTPIPTGHVHQSALPRLLAPSCELFVPRDWWTASFLGSTSMLSAMVVVVITIIITIAKIISIAISSVVAIAITTKWTVDFLVWIFGTIGI